MRRRIVITVALISAIAAAVVVARAAPPPVASLGHSDHVFVIVLENENADQTFGPNTEIPYLANTLKAQGRYLPNYYGIAHNSLPNYIAMVSGQPPSTQTQADCPGFTQFQPGTPTDG